MREVTQLPSVPGHLVLTPSSNRHLAPPSAQPAEENDQRHPPYKQRENEHRHKRRILVEPRGIASFPFSICSETKGAVRLRQDPNGGVNENPDVNGPVGGQAALPDQPVP